MRSLPLVVEEIDSFERFGALGTEWNDLLARSPQETPAMTHDWLVTWWKHLGAGARLCVIVGRTGDRLRFAFPLMEVRKRLSGVPLRVLHAMTDARFFHFGFLVERGAEEEAARALGEHLRGRRRRWDCVVLAHVAADAAGLREILAMAAAGGYPHGTWRASDSPYLEIAGDWETYFAGLKRKHRYNLRSRSKRLAKLGSVAYPLLARPTPADVEEGLAIEAAGWKGERGSAVLSVPAIAAFFREWTQVAAGRGWLRLAFLEVGGRRIAVEFLFVHGRTAYPLKIGYDPGYATYSPGQILCAENLRRAFAGELAPGIRTYDFLGAFSTQKRDWTDRGRPVVHVHVYNRTLRGRLGHWAKFVLGPCLQSLRRRSAGGA